MTLDQGIQLGVAIGTISVAILAIWGDRIRLYLGLGPKLILTLDDPQGELVPILDGQGRSIPSRYYHLRVKNMHRWTRATNVRTVITDVRTPAADGKFVSQPLSGPLQLMWRFTKFHPIYSIVGPDDICDLGHLFSGGEFELTPFIVPGNLKVTIGPREKMRIEVKAVADNAESKPLWIDISWDGCWKDDTLEMSKHLVVKTEKSLTIESN